MKTSLSLSLRDLATRLVGFNTISSKSPVPMADFICEYLEGCGFIIERYPYVKEGIKKVNIIARKGGQESRLVYSGHMDTVPCGSGWDNKIGDPFSLVEADVTGVGKVFQGLGIADMKLFLAIAMKAGEAVSIAELKHPFALCFTSDEEVGCKGAKKLRDILKQQGKMLGKYVVVGEPTEFKPVYAHKGYIFLEVVIGAYNDKHGKSGVKDNPCHSSNPFTTTNVIEKALGPVIDELHKFKVSLAKVCDLRFNPPFPTMNIGGNILVGRTWQDNKGLKVVDKVANNIIPRGFLIESDIRIVPGQDPLDIINIITSNIDERIKTIKPTVSNESFDLKVKHRKSYPMETAKESSIVMAIEDIMNCPAITAAFNTEGSIFNDIGSETVIWGPSDINQAHKDNEYVLAELFKDETVEKYIRLIKRMCI